MKKIAFFEINKSEQDYVKKQLKGFKILFFEEEIQNVNPKKFLDVDLISVFIYSKVSEDIINQIPKLKGIITRSTGFDHIDTTYCSYRNIEVGNVPFYGENTVAEHTFALILNLSRKVHESYNRCKNENFSNEGLEGFDLKDKTLGIIGVGHIGMHVIRMAKGFGMHVKAFDLNKDEFTAEILHFDYASLDEILKTSDIISLHMPYNKFTHHFIDNKKISQMKKGVIIINTARGALIDTNALYSALKNNHVGGAGLDVIEGEELIKEQDDIMNSHSRKKIFEIFRDKEIFKMPNVIFTPHNAFNSKEAKQRILDSTIENIKELKENNKLKYKVKIS